MVQSQVCPCFIELPVTGPGNSKGEARFSLVPQYVLAQEVTELATPRVLRFTRRSAGVQLLQLPDEEDEPELPQRRCYGHTLRQHALPHPSESAQPYLPDGAQRLRRRRDSSDRGASHLVLWSWGGQGLFDAAPN